MGINDIASGVLRSASTAETIRELTIELCIQVIQARYIGDNNREDMEVKACVNTLRRLKMGADGS